MGEIIDFASIFRIRERQLPSPSLGGEIIPFLGVRYSRPEGVATEFISPNGFPASGRKRRKGKGR
ncbi:MAG: hypothetical protein ACKOC1_11480 [Hyphomicrobiales bacterium]